MKLQTGVKTQEEMGGGKDERGGNEGESVWGSISEQPLQKKKGYVSRQEKRVTG